MTKEEKKRKAREASRRWREKHPERAREVCRRSHARYKDVYKTKYAPRQSQYQKKYRASLTPDEKKDRNLRKKYGITLADYTRMWKEQLGLCAVCDKPLETRRPHVDHDHETGIVRALLCQHCNQALGMIFESPYLALRLRSYLLKHGKLG